MEKTLNFFIGLILVFLSQLGLAQEYHFDYKRELKGITDQWHTVILPNEILECTYNNLGGIRIIGITKDNDTLKVPYILKLSKEKTTTNLLEFDILNQSYSTDGYYVTFQIEENRKINQIELEFDNQNFDVNIKLEGSLDQKAWNTIVDQYRLLSINTAQAKFTHTTLDFPLSNYSFYRVLIKDVKSISLNKAVVKKNEVEPGRYDTFEFKATRILEPNAYNQTEIEVELSEPSRLSQLFIHVSDKTNFYRPIRISYLNDSIKTEKGWKYTYSPLTSGTLTSVQPNQFQFQSTRVKHLKFVIDNFDNEPLTIHSIEAKGYLHQLVARFDKPATYFILYGNNRIPKPNYDIERYAKDIPKELKPLAFGKAQKIAKPEKAEKDPFITNKLWLWALMVVIVLLLGAFTLKMMKQH